MNQEQTLDFFSHRPSFTLPNFQGPLELLLYLVQKEEIDLFEIFLNDLTDQFLEHLSDSLSMDLGTDFLSIGTTLILMKSRKLLPKTEVLSETEETEEPRIQLIEYLLEYCRLRDLTDELSSRENRERIFFCREAPPPSRAPRLGLEEIELKDLTSLLQEILKKAPPKAHLIHQENWTVAPKIHWLKDELIRKERIDFFSLFSGDKCREELIVLFLALLELMKLQEVCLQKGLSEETSQLEEIWIIKHPDK